MLLAGPAAGEQACAEAPQKDCIPAPPGLQDMVPDLDILKTPLSPALSLVGGAPVDIERPTTPTGAAMSLGTGIAHGLFVPGTSTAVEVTPYWLWPRPALTAAKALATPGLAFVRDFSLSFAAAPGANPAKPPDMTPAPTTPDTIPTTNDAGLVALGLRTTIWPGDLSEAAQSCVTRLDEFAKGDVSLRAPEEAAFTAKWQKENPTLTRVEVSLPQNFGDPADVKRYQGAMTAANVDYSNRAAAQLTAYHEALQTWLAAWTKAHGVPDDVAACASIIHHRVGFIASVAGAALVSAPGGDFGRWRQGGTTGETAWLTAGYSWFLGRYGVPGDVSVLGALRLRHQEIVDTTVHTNAGDYGGRVVGAFARWGVSVQVMHLGPGANGFGSNTSWQGGLAIDYHLKSGFWLTATAGSTDLEEIDSWSTATALIRLQYNVGRDRLILTDDSATSATSATP